MEEQKGIFSKMSPKSGFLAGIGAALAVFFMIGFFVLLVMVLGGKDDADIAKDDSANPSVAGEQDPTNPQYTDIPLSEISDSDWVRGNKDAKIAIVEFTDIECPYCQQFHETMVQVLDAYPNDVKWVYRHLPLPSLHPNAPKDAEAAECVGELGGQEAFWEYVDTLYSSSLSGVDQLVELAVGQGIDRDAFRTCLSSGKYTSKVSAQADEGAQAAEASTYLDSDSSNDGRWGTPFSVIVYGDQKIPIPGAYPFEYVQQVIDQLLAQ